MSLPQENQDVYEAEVVYEASLVEHESNKRNSTSAGCLVGLVLGGIFFILLLVGLVARAVYLSSIGFGPIETVDTQVDVFEAADFVQGVGSNRVGDDDAAEHPDFKKIDKFVGRLASCLDGEANIQVRKLIDHKRYWKEMCKRSEEYYYQTYLSRRDIKDLQDAITGPAEFGSQGKEYEIVRVEKTDEGYRVALSYDKGYGYDELQVWWITERDRRLRLYDWFDAESGLRGSGEDAAFYDATPTQERGYNQHATDTNAYFEVDDDLDSAEFQQQIKVTLKRCETYWGPPSLQPSSKLVIAKRWAHHGEPHDALRVVEYVSPTKTPGVSLLRGKILFENDLFEEARREYEQFASVAGSYPWLEKRLIECARGMGDFDGEQQLLAKFCNPVRFEKSDQLAALVELNSEAENEELFRKIDALDKKHEVYKKIQARLKYNRFQHQRLKQLKSHLERTMPDSFLARNAGVTSDSKDEYLIQTLQWLDSLSDDESSTKAYEFWSGIADDRIPKILTTSKKREENFAAITQYYDYEDYLPSNADEICDLVLEENPKSASANRWLGSFLLDQKKFDEAIEKLVVALDSLGADDEGAAGCRYLILRALQGKGDSKAQLEWARDHEMTNSLLQMKFAMKDDSNVEDLLELLDKESVDYRYYLACLKARRGETEAATKELVKLTRETEETDQQDYRFSWQLGQIFSKADHPEKMVELFPDERRFWEVANIMLANRDWEGCKRLLEMKEAGIEDAQRCLRLRLDWEQGNYKTLAALPVDSSEIPASYSNLEQIYGELARACIHEGEYAKAKKWAQKCNLTNDVTEYLVGIAIEQQDWKEAEKQLRMMDDYSKESLVADLWLWDRRAMDQPEVAALVPPISGSYRPSSVELGFLFDSEPEINELNFSELFRELLGERVTETEFAKSEGGEQWKSLSSESFDVLVNVKKPNYLNSRTDEDGEDSQIQKMFPKAKTRIDLTIWPKSPMSSAESMKLVDGFGKPMCKLKPILFGRAYFWLSSDKFDAYFNATSKRENALRVSESCRGIWSYPLTQPKGSVDQSSASQSDVAEFQEKLVAALRRFVASKDPAKSFVVATPIETEAKRFEIKVDRIKRNSWGGVNVIGNAEPMKNVPEMVVPQRQVSVAVSNIVRFEASFDQESIREKVPRN